MGTIKDLVDLVTQLSSRVKDRRFAAELRQIQTMVVSIQSEQAVIHEKSIELMTENAELKQQIAALQIELAESKKPKPDGLNELCEEATKVLVFVAYNENSTVDRIIHGTQLNRIRAERWLEELEDNEFIYSPRIIGSPPIYSLFTAGKKYLVEKGLA